MYYAFRAGSFEAFVRDYSGSEYARDYPEFLASVVGEYTRITRGL
jgi:hypothetical protein